MSKYLPRLMEQEFENVSSVMRIVLISGPRQCGKTTLLRHMLTDSDSFFSMDDAATRNYAAEEPAAFLREAMQSCRRLAVDEVQKAPALLGQMKFVVDQTQDPGQFLLSGSSNFRTLPAANESLAGRLGEVRLRTLTAAEIAGTDKHSFIEDLIAGRFAKTEYSPEECSKSVVLEKALRGGYPSVFSQPARSRKIWFSDYLNALFEKDLADVAGFAKRDALPLILQRLAAVSSRTVNISAIAGDLKTDSRHVDKFVQTLKAMYLTDAVPAWTRKPYDRMTKSPKWLLTDTGLMSAVLGHYDPQKTMEWIRRNDKVGTDFLGCLTETWVYTQIAPLAEFGREWSLYHLRASQRQEIDFVLENDQGDMVALEVKASESVHSEDFAHIRWLRDLCGERVLVGAVLYCGQHVRNFGEGLWAVPMAALWS